MKTGCANIPRALQQKMSIHQPSDEKRHVQAATKHLATNKHLTKRPLHIKAK